MVKVHIGCAAGVQVQPAAIGQQGVARLGGAGVQVGQQLAQGLAAGADYLLVSPYEGLSSPVVASAWGVQLSLDDAADPRLQTFLDTYLQGEQTPEPGAACFGGVDGA